MCDTCVTTPTTNYAVSGMSCGHCRTAITAAVSALPGVQNVEVDVASGTVSVTSPTPVPQDALRAAIEEAGYQLTGEL